MGAPWFRAGTSVLATVLFAALVATGCGGGSGSGGKSSSSSSKGASSGSSSSSSSSASLTTPGPDDWGLYGYDSGNTRHVPFTKVTPANVGQLGVAWTADLQKYVKDLPGGQQASALKIGKTVYVSTSFNNVFALDATDGSEKWHYTPSNIGAFKNFGVTANRGVAACGGSLFELTLDMRIIKLDAGTGKVQQELKIGDVVPDAKPEFGYYNSAAPLCAGGKLYFGASGGDNGIRGFYMAVNTKDLSPAWDSPHWNIPPEGQGWRAKGRFHGGGSTWMIGTIDEQAGLVYVAAGNPSPDFFPQLRPGNNPGANTLFAIDAKTGDTVWQQQQLKYDAYDYDTDTSPMLFDAKVGGATKRLVSVGNKEGKWFAYDAKTGTPINAGGTIVVDAFNHSPLKPGVKTIVSPSTLGGVNFAAQSFDPTTNYAYVASIDSKSELIQNKSAADVDKDRIRGDVDTGAVNGFGDTPKGWHDSGNIVAVDPSGKIAWKADTPEPERGGVTTTASGLAFAGGGDGVLRAFDSKTGKVLWHFQTGAQIAAPPTIYQQDGVEYVLIPIGGTFTSSQGGKLSRVMAFKLGGDTTQLPAPNLKPPSKAAAATSNDNKSPLAKYLKAGSKAGTVNPVLVGAEGSAGGGMNFNGYSRGGMTYTIPTGTEVAVDFRNAASTVPHSVLVAPASETSQTQKFDVAFSGATMQDASTGIQSGSAHFTFTADKAGTYAFLCGVPGHSSAGMWITLKVVDGAKTASVSTRDGQSYSLPSGTVGAAVTH